MRGYLTGLFRFLRVGSSILSLHRKGFDLHRFSDVRTRSIGDHSTVWQYSVVLPGASIGSNVNICSHCFVENDVLIGNNVTIKNGVRIFDGVIIENNVFIGPNVVFTNDKYPKSKVWAHTDLKTHVSEGASIGANAVILPGVSIGKHALVGAGSVVTRSVPDFAVAFGSPAVVKRYAAQRSAPFPEFSAFSGG